MSCAWLLEKGQAFIANFLDTHVTFVHLYLSYINYANSYTKEGVPMHTYMTAAWAEVRGCEDEEVKLDCEDCKAAFYKLCASLLCRRPM